jgi:hypothetical protein
MKKIIISKKQLNLLTNFINENTQQEILIKKIKKDLDTNYKPTFLTYKKGGEYFEKPMILNKVDKEYITLNSLYEYIKYKYKLNDDFIKQLINDWFNGDLNDYKLSKNISLE